MLYNNKNNLGLKATFLLFKTLYYNKILLKEKIVKVIKILLLKTELLNKIKLGFELKPYLKRIYAIIALPGQILKKSEKIYIY